MALEQDRNLQEGRQKIDPTLLPVRGPSTLAEAAPKSATIHAGDQPPNWSKKTRRATEIKVRGSQEEDLFDKPPSATEKDVEIFLRRSELATIFVREMNNVTKLVDHRIISTLKSCVVESHAGLIRAAVSTAVTTVIDGWAGEKMMSELDENTASQAVTSQDVTKIVAHKAQRLRRADGRDRTLCSRGRRGRKR